MAKKKTIPQYTSVERKGIQYYRTRILDADGKQVSLYATTCEELYEKQLAARRQVQEILFHRQHPTVAEYCEKWLVMQSAKVSERIYFQHEELRHQANGRYVYGGSNG
jgi:integrase